MTKFEIGRLVLTDGISTEFADNKEFADEVRQSYAKYTQCDWGDTCKNDAKLNDDAIKNNDRIVAKYNTSKGAIFIITEWDRSYTTIMFTYEY